MADITDTLEFLKTENSGAVSLLHCVSIYPSVAEDLNLELIPLLKNMFGKPVGYSDHFPGTRACLAAAMLGAEIIETHFTLDSAQPEGDHHHSVEPEDLKTLIDDIYLHKIMRGDVKNIYERPDRHLAATYRRGLYTARSLAKGEVLKVEDMLMCRPTSDLSPNDITRLIGKRINQALPAQTALKESHFEH
jgi:sialic acid synthase SpsE